MCKIYVLAVLLTLGFVSCKKDKTSNSVSGIYTETTPVAGRSQLNFINSGLVVKTETGSNYKDTFSYSILPGKILLKAIWSSQYPAQEFEFEKIDNNTFKIQNLYPGIPEAPISYMTFKK